MTSLRAMTYNVGGFRGYDGRIDADRVAAVIAEAAPAFVALQQAGSDERTQQRVAERLGMALHGRGGSSLLLSDHPLRAVASFDLGDGGSCQRADLDVAGRRLHVFNVVLTGHWSSRRSQSRVLLGPELLGRPDLPCPVLLLGDFAGSCWRLQCLGLPLDLRGVSRPWRSATFPAQRPCSSRDRAYLRGALRVERSAVHDTPLARTAAPHLPFCFTLQLEDTRTFLRLGERKEFRRGQMETAPG